MSSSNKRDHEVKKNLDFETVSEFKDQAIEPETVSVEVESNSSSISGGFQAADVEEDELVFLDASMDEKKEIATDTPSKSDSDLEVEVVTRSSKSKPLNYMVHAVIAVAAVLLLVLLSFLFIKDSEESIAQAQTAVQNIYLDEERVFLKEDIRQEDFDLARKVVNELTWRQRKPYLEELDAAQDKYETLSQMNQFYQTEQMLINGNQQVPYEELVLAPEVSEESVKARITSMNEVEEDAMWVAIRSYHDHVIESLNQIELVKEHIAALPKDVTNRGALTDVVNQVVEVESIVQPLAKHPQMGEVNHAFQAYANTIGQIFVAGGELGDYEPTLVESIYESEVLSKSLIGTPYDRSPLIALTFDDGPNDVYTPQLLDVLAKHDVKATFFVMGAYVDEYPEVARRIVEEGHIIANHTYSHPDLSTSTDEEVLLQFEWAQESIEDATGIIPDMYRLPFGAGGKRVIDLMSDMTSILWNIDSYDWESGDVDVIYETIMNQLQHHSLLLMHDTHQATPDTIDRLIPILKEQGYSFVRPDTLDFDMRYFAE